MKKSPTRPNYTIKEQQGRYAVYDRNQHYRCSFATRAAAEAYIASQRQRLGVQAVR
jgi:hypothetical protein